MKFEFKMNKLGKRNHILGVRVEFVKNEISLYQRQYIDAVCLSTKKNKVYTFDCARFGEGVRTVELAP